MAAVPGGIAAHRLRSAFERECETSEIWILRYSVKKKIPEELKTVIAEKERSHFS